MAIRVPEVQAQGCGIIHPPTDIRSLQRIRVRIIHSGSVRIELIAENVVIKTPASASQRGVALGRFEITSLGPEAEFGHAGAASARRYLYHTGHGIGPVKGALRAAHEFQAIPLRE